MSRLVSQLDPLRGDRRGHPGHIDRLLCRPRRGLGREVHGRREPPHAVHHHPDGQAEVIGVEQGFQAGVRQPDALPADPLGAEVGVLRAEIGRPLKRGVGECAQRQGGELGIDPVRDRVS